MYKTSFDKLFPFILYFAVPVYNRSQSGVLTKGNGPIVVTIITILHNTAVAINMEDMKQIELHRQDFDFWESKWLNKVYI